MKLCGFKEIAIYQLNENFTLNKKEFPSLERIFRHNYSNESMICLRLVNYEDVTRLSHESE